MNVLHAGEIIRLILSAFDPVSTDALTEFKKMAVGSETPVYRVLATIIKYIPAMHEQIENAGPPLQSGRRRSLYDCHN